MSFTPPVSETHNRCKWCGVRCSDPQAREIHERFCQKKSKKHNRDRGRTVVNGSSDQTDIPFGPGRVCFSALLAGIYGEGGVHPRCLGPECSDWEKCLFESHAYADDLKYLKKHPQKQRPRRSREKNEGGGGCRR